LKVAATRGGKEKQKEEKAKEREREREGRGRKDGIDGGEEVFPT